MVHFLFISTYSMFHNNVFLFLFFGPKNTSVIHIWYICISFVSLSVGIVYIMDFTFVITLSWLCLIHLICHLLFEFRGCSSVFMIASSHVDCSDPKLLYADIVPCGRSKVYVAWQSTSRVGNELSIPECVKNGIYTSCLHMNWPKTLFIKI